MNHTLRSVLFRLPAVLYMGFIFYMSSGPVESDTLQRVPDYVLHACGYAALYALVHVACHEGVRVRSGRGSYWLPLLITILYGISDEFHQSFVPSRDASLRDLLADGLGGLVGAAALKVLAPIDGVQQVFDRLRG